MLKVVKLVARSFDLDHVDLFWETTDFVAASAQDVITAYDFYVERSESPEGPWDPLAGPFQDQYLYRDFSPNLLHKWRKLFYRLRVVHKPTSEEEVFGPTALLPEPDLIALEIQRQEDVLFREFNGRRCWVFPVRTFGAKCGCVNKISGRRTRTGCLTCFDTGYMGGFLRPIECFVQIDPEAHSSSNTNVHGERQEQNTSARLISFPPIKPKDILVEAENKRWRIVTVAKTERLRSIVHQEPTLHQIPRGDIEYKLPINLEDLQNQEWAGERNFTNPQHVNEHEDDDPFKLLAVYGYKPRGSV